MSPNFRSSIIRTKLPIVLAGLLACSVAVPAPAQKPKPKPKPQQPYTIPGPVSISAKPNPTVFSTPVTITGRVDKAGAGVRVTLFRRTVPSTTWVGVSTANTVNNGGYTFTHRPARNTYYRVVAQMSPPVNSGDLLVPVRMLVGLRLSDSTPKRGSLVRFSGIVRPRHNGRRAYIQKRGSGGRWVTVKRTTLRSVDSRTSRYAVRIRVRSSGVYRARVLGHLDHAMGISRERAVTVH